MGLNLFGRFMPTEESFTRLFCEQVTHIVAVADELRAIAQGTGAIDQHVVTIRAIEARADAVAKKVFLAANRTFNAPIDREEIVGLAHDLDDVVDLVEDVAKAIQRYRMQEFSTEMRAMIDSLVQSAALLQKAVPLLDNISREHRKIQELCEAVGTQEGQADDSFDAGLFRLRGRLTSGEIDTITYLDRKEIYELLEQVVDKCDDVANTIETITIKHV
jgi:uncharacterized protein Yka (UPF0111/DUF47 family)